MKSIDNKALIGFILFMPFTSAFAISGTINLPIIAGVFLFLVLLFQLTNSRALPFNFLSIESIAIFLFLFFVLLSYLINGSSYSFSFNHLLAYYSTFLLFFLSPLLFFTNSIEIEKVFQTTLKYIFFAVLISAIFSIFEFTLTNFLAINVTDFVPRANVKEYDPLITGFLIRSRGFAEESGHYGFMMELFAPISVYYLYFSKYCNYSNTLKNIFTFCIVLSIITSFSVSTFILLPFCLVLSLIIKFKLIIKAIVQQAKKIIITLVILIIIWQVINLFIPLNEILLITLDEKFDSFSLNDRLERSNYFWSTFPKLPLENILFGSGPSWYKILGLDESFSFLSLYQTITFENGLFGLLCIVVFFSSILVKLFRIKHTISIFFFTSFLCGILHYNNISNYWYPWFWFLISFIMFYYYSFSLKHENEN